MPISSRMRIAPLWMRSTASCVERLDRPVAVLRDRPRHLVDGAAAGAAQISGAAAGAPRAALLRLFARVEH